MIERQRLGRRQHLASARYIPARGEAGEVGKTAGYMELLDMGNIIQTLGGKQQG